MAVTFTTKASADITMLDVHARQMLDLIGKEYGTRGVITAGEAAAAAAKLKAAGGTAKASEAQQGRTADDGDDDSGRDTVPLHVRAQPFIDMLENAAAKNKDILWGV